MNKNILKAILAFVLCVTAAARALAMPDLSVGEFAPRDPGTGYQQTANLYEFCGNDPVNRIDPWGLTTYFSDTPFDFSQAGALGPYSLTVNDGSSAVLPAVPWLTDSQGLQSTDLDFLPFVLPEIPAVSKALDAAGDALGNTLEKMGVKKPKLPKAPIKCPTKPLTRGQLAQSLDPAQRNLLRQLFGNGPEGAEKALEAFKAGGQIPSGLSMQTLQTYQQIAQMSIDEGIDSIGTQAARLQLINAILNQR